VKYKENSNDGEFITEFERNLKERLHDLAKTFWVNLTLPGNPPTTVNGRTTNSSQ
jgi:hypothetical protein